MNRYLSLIIICLFYTSFLPAQNDLQSQLNKLLEEEPLLKTSEVGISVFDLTSGQPLFNYQDKKLYRPASVEKLITGITGIATLGANYTFDTSLYYSGTITNKKLNGDLYIIGGFDPEFGEAGMEYLLNLIDSMGIKKIKGNLFGDTSMMDSVYWGPGWSWDDTPFEFQPYLSPLMYCKGYVEVTAIPSQKGLPAKLTINPVSSYYTVDNQTQSDTPSAGKFIVTRNWLNNGNRITVKGNIDIPRKERVNIYTSKDLFMHALLDKLQERGISIEEYSWKECPMNESTFFIGKYSHSITNVLNRAMKKSDNLSAEAIFYHLGAQYAQKKQIGSQDGSEAIYSFIHQLGMNARSYKIVDGSGISLYNYVSPELILSYLKFAHANPDVYNQLYKALPIAGADGTLVNRMKQGKAYCNVRAKTGSVTGISSLAGYVQAANGHMLAFVIINQNILEQKKAHAFQDRVCEILSEMN